MSEKIAVVGLGYVGLPLAVALSAKFEVVGFDKSEERVLQLKDGIDSTHEVASDLLKESPINFTFNPQDMADCTSYIVAVPTPIDQSKKPDLSIMKSASRTVGEVINADDLVIYESTVYPGVTEGICGPILAETSGLELYKEIKLGYSPERINPGDKERTIEKIVKVVSGQDEETLERVNAIYAPIITAGTHRAPTIKVAEAAKVIENTQRDLNIALMNELAVIFEKLDINTKDVLAAAGTKWNFLPFTPGLVGGHCIGVDPYYLTSKAEEVGYNPRVILAGRRINDDMGKFIAQKTIKMMLKNKIDPTSAKVGIYGITFKENVPDIRNSKVITIIEELREYGVDVDVFDPYANEKEVEEEYGLTLADKSKIKNSEAIILAVPHDSLLGEDIDILQDESKILVDVKSVTKKENSDQFWSL